MTKLAQIIAEAQRTAARDGAPRTVLNLNTVGAAMYVIRDYPGEETLAKACEREGARFLVAVVQPDGAAELRGGYSLDA